MRLWKRREASVREPYAGPIVLEAIGHVRNAVRVPRPRGWEKVESEIHVAAEHTRRLAGLDGYSHAIVVFYMDMAGDAPEKPETLMLASGREYGIFATRSQLRPNHLGVAAVTIVNVEGPVLRVRGLDAIDGTAVVDIKPYIPLYDAHPGARMPGEGGDRP